MSFHIALPATNFMDGEEGQEVFSIDQFGAKVGSTNNGDVVTKSSDPYYVYFEYEMNDSGSFDIFCEIVNDAELEDILDDIDEEDEEEDEEEDLDEESELKMGEKDEKEEHGFSNKLAKKVANDHLKKVDPHYYTKLKKIGLEEDKMSEEQLNELSAGKLFKYVRDAKSDRKQALADRDHYKKNLTDPDRAWTKGIPHKDSQYKMAVDRNAHAAKRTKSINLAVKKIASKSKVDEGLKMGDYGHIKAKEAAKAPFDNPTEKPSTPYKNPHSKAKQLARAAMNKAKKVAEDYDHKEKNSAYVAKAFRDFQSKYHSSDENMNKLAKKNSKFWAKKYKEHSKKAVTGMDEEKLDEVSASKLGRYVAKASKQKENIQKRMNAGIDGTGEGISRKLFRTGMRRVGGTETAVKKLTGKAKVPASINEVSHELAKRAEHKAADKYHDAYDAETDARKKLIKTRSPEDRDAAGEAKEKRTKAAKRVIKFQNYAEKKKKLKEENINEISAGKANDAYHAAADKGKTADVMAGATGSKKWRKRANKKWDQARKFADYADKKSVKEETKQLEYRPTSIPDKDKGPFTKKLQIQRKSDCAEKK